MLVCSLAVDTAASLAEPSEAGASAVPFQAAGCAPLAAAVQLSPHYGFG